MLSFLLFLLPAALSLSCSLSLALTLYTCAVSPSLFPGKQATSSIAHGAGTAEEEGEEGEEELVEEIPIVPGDDSEEEEEEEGDPHTLRHLFYFIAAPTLCYQARCVSLSLSLSC